MDTRFKISEKLHRQMLEEMSDRILKEQVRNIYICAELI